MFEIVDYRYEWCDTYGWLIICMKFTETNEHFYIRHMITNSDQARKFIEFWESHTTIFLDVLYEHPN